MASGNGSGQTWPNSDDARRESPGLEPFEFRVDPRPRSFSELEVDSVAEFPGGGISRTWRISDRRERPNRLRGCGSPISYEWRYLARSPCRVQDEVGNCDDAGLDQSSRSISGS